MKELAIKLRNKIISFIYKYILKPIFFQIDPEKVHDRMLVIGQLLGLNIMAKNLTSFLFSYSNPKLEQKILGISFKNPVGLSAGFDKNAELTEIIPEIGFGFEEIGSITGEPCEGNEKPRLWRLKKSKALVVNYGLKNKGSEAISNQLKNNKFKLPIFTSIAKTNSKETVDTHKGIADYVKTYKYMSNIGNISVINLSCPNAFGGQPFHDKDKLNTLLKEIIKIKTNKPIFLKLSPDLNKNQIDSIINLSKKYKISGFICTNLTKIRTNKILDKNIPAMGGISGKIVEDLSNEQIKYIYKKTKGKFIIVGVGGIFSAEDAYKKMKLGASFVSLITGMIFEGPQLISQINQGLVKLLENDGFKNISEAIGVDNK